MPPFEFSSAHEAFAKLCPDCNNTFVGTRDQAESEKIFHKHFHFNRHVADGFMTYCRSCQHERIRRRNGVVGEINVPALFAEQDGKCAICTNPILLYQGRGSGAQLDHDHETGVIRGLLCLNCNQGLGKFKESITILELALAYLQKHTHTP